MKRIFSLLVFCFSIGISHAQWVASNTGLTGGYVDNLAIDPVTHYIYAGTNQGGIYQSKDNGTSWSSVSNGLPQGSVTAITISGTTIYAGTSSGIYLSNNNGSSWAGTNNSAVSSASAIVKSGSNIFAGSPGLGVSLSTDNCATWIPLNNGLNDQARSVYTILINSGSILLGTGDGVYISTNNGGLWTKSNTGLTNVVSSFAVLGSYIFAGTYSGMFVSGNNGASWTKVSNGLTETGSYVNKVIVNGTSIYAATEGGIYLSTDNGAVWTAKNNGLLNDNLSFTSIAADGINLFAGNRFGAGVFRTSNAGNLWTKVNTGLSNTVISGIAQAGDNLFAAGYGIAMSANHGDTWTNVNNGIPASGLFACKIAVRGTKIFCGTLKDGVYLSEDNGNTWSAINNGLSGNGLNINDLSVAGNNIFASTNGGVFLSVNDGASWVPVMSSLYAWTLATYGNTVFVNTSNGIFMSANNGGTWAKPDNGLPETQINQIVLSGTRLFAATFKGVYMSEDNGNTWVRRFRETDYNPVSSIVVSGDMIFASTIDDSEGGIYVSNDYGISWALFNEGLSTTNIYKIAINENSVIACTRGYGVFKRLIADFKVLSVSTDNLNITDPEIRTATFNIISNIDWTISGSESWISINNDMGSGNATIILTAEKNNTGAIRSADIKISGEGVEDHIITVSQALDLTTAVYTYPEDPEIIIYPNPATDILNLNGIPENTLASIYDSQGKLVMTKQLNVCQIDISKLSNGLYMIRFSNNLGVTLRRFVKK